MQKNLLQTNDIPKVMVDNSIESNANPARWESIDSEPIGGVHFANKLLVCRGKELHPKSERLNTDMPFAHAIANVAKENKFIFYTYSELECEHIMGYQSMASWGTIFYPFRGISYERVDPPIVRGEFFQSRDWASKKEIDKFIKWLLEVDMSKMPDFKKLTKPIKSNFERLDEFRKMVSEIGKKSARDVYHLWVAECNNLDYFLTVDYKFLDSFKLAVKNRRINPKCMAVSPQDLAEKFSLTLENVKLPKEGQYYLMSGLEYNPKEKQ